MKPMAGNYKADHMRSTFAEKLGCEESSARLRGLYYILKNTTRSEKTFLYKPKIDLCFADVTDIE